MVKKVFTADDYDSLDIVIQMFEQAQKFIAIGEFAKAGESMNLACEGAKFILRN
jgi:hypothetical protein